MVGFLVFVTIIVLGVVGIRLQLRHAEANYPSSWRWRLALFAPPFLLFSLLGYVIASSGDNTALFKVLFGFAVGLFAGLSYTFLFPRNLQNVIPKRKP